MFLSDLYYLYGKQNIFFTPSVTHQQTKRHGISEAGGNAVIEKKKLEASS